MIERHCPLIETPEFAVQGQIVIPIDVQETLVGQYPQELLPRVARTNTTQRLLVICRPGDAEIIQEFGQFHGGCTQNAETVTWLTPFKPIGGDLENPCLSEKELLTDSRNFLPFSAETEPETNEPVDRQPIFSNLDEGKKIASFLFRQKSRLRVYPFLPLIRYYPYVSAQMPPGPKTKTM